MCVSLFFVHVYWMVSRSLFIMYMHCRCPFHNLLQFHSHTVIFPLQGFWDMVSIQVDDVRCKFERLAELERNDWKQPHVEQNRTKKQGKVYIIYVYVYMYVHVFLLFPKIVTALLLFWPLKWEHLT